MRTICTLLLLTSAPALATDVLILNTGGEAALADDVIATLAASGLYTTIDTWDARVSVATEADLAPYNVVITFTNYSWIDGATQGDELYDYIFSGGGVVLTDFEWTFPALQGDLANIMPLTSPTLNGYGSPDTLGATVPHPITLGVSTFEDPQFHSPDAIPANGGILVASYASGSALAAYAPAGLGTIAALNCYPVSDNVGSPFGPGQGDFWNPATDGATLLNNTLAFVAGVANNPFATSAAGTCGGPATITTSGATPGGNLAYVTGTAGGASVVPAGPCAGTALPVGSPRLRATRTADAAGSDVVNVPSLGPAVCGATYVVLDSATCQVASAVLP